MARGIYTTRFNNKQILETSFNLLDEKITPINKVVIEGQIQAPITIVTECDDVDVLPITYIQFPLCVYRVSKNKITGIPYLKSPDFIPVRIKFTDLIEHGYFTPELSELEGKYLRISEGIYRSSYVTDETGHHVAFHVSVNDFNFITEEECKYTNRIFLRGFICNETFDVRRTNSGPILDLKLAVNRVEYTLEDLQERKRIPTDYIQCITWNDVTKYLTENLTPGDLIDIEGRIQSRSFPSDFYKKVVHEVSVVDLN